MGFAQNICLKQIIVVGLFQGELFWDLETIKKLIFFYFLSEVLAIGFLLYNNKLSRQNKNVQVHPIQTFIIDSY